MEENKVLELLEEATITIPVEDTIKELLNKLSEMQSAKDVSAMAKQALIDSVLTPEIKAKIADIEAEFVGKDETIDASIYDLTDTVKSLVLKAGGSVKGEHLHAIYGKGRISWDTKGLDGFSVAHPEILFMRKEGDPSVSIRKS